MTDSHKNITVLHTVVNMFGLHTYMIHIKNKIKSKYLDDKLCNKNIKIITLFRCMFDYMLVSSGYCFKFLLAVVAEVESACIIWIWRMILPFVCGKASLFSEAFATGCTDVRLYLLVNLAPFYVFTESEFCATNVRTFQALQITVNLMYIVHMLFHLIWVIWPIFSAEFATCAAFDCTIKIKFAQMYWSVVAPHWIAVFEILNTGL